MAGNSQLRLDKYLLIGILLLILFDFAVGQSFRRFTRSSREWRPRSLRGQIPRSFPGQQNIRGFRSSLASSRSRFNSLFFDDSGIQPNLWNIPFSTRTGVTDPFSQPQVIRIPAPNLSEVRVPGVRRTRIPSGDSRRGPIRIVTRHNDHRQSSAFSVRSPVQSQQQQFLRRDMNRQASPTIAHGRTRPNEQIRGDSLPQVMRRPPTRILSSERAPQVIRIPANGNSPLIRQNGGPHLPMVTRQRFSQEATSVQVRSRAPTVVRRPDAQHIIQTNDGNHRFQTEITKQNQNKNDDVTQFNIQFTIDGSSKTGQPSQSVKSPESVMTHAQPILHVEPLPVQTGSQPILKQTVPFNSGSPVSTQAQTSLPPQTSEQIVLQQQQNVLPQNTIVQERPSVMQTPVISQAVPVSGTYKAGVQTVQQSVTPVQTEVLAPGPAQTSQTIDLTGNATTKTSETSDLIFEELVNAFTDVLQQPSNQRSTIIDIGTPVVHSQHPQTVLQKSLQQPAVVQSQGGHLQQQLGTGQQPLTVHHGHLQQQLGTVQQPLTIHQGHLQQQLSTGQQLETVHQGHLQPQVGTGQQLETVHQGHLQQQLGTVQQPNTLHLGLLQQQLGTVQQPVTVHQGHLQPQFGMVQQAGMLHQGQMMMNPMFGGHMNMMNPWMMSRMTPDMMQEMLYGDTTDPPEPVTTTTVAPPVKIAPVVDASNPVIAPEVAPVDTAAINVVATAMPTAEVQNATLQRASGSTLVNEIPIAGTGNTVVKVNTSKPPMIDVSGHVITPADPTLASLVESATPTVPSVPSSSLITASPAHVATMTVSKIPEMKTLIEQITTMPEKKSSPKSLEEKIMAEVAKMLSNQKVDMSLLPQVVGQVAAEFQSSGPEVAPSATLLGLTTPGPQMATSTLTKKEKVKELIGSTRGIVVYPPTPPSLLQPTRNDVTSPPKDTVRIPEVNKVTFTDQAPRATIPPHADIPTLPPSKSKQNSNPDIYRTLETILNHDPAAIIKVLQEQTTLAPQATTPGPKISIHSLVDFGKLHNFTNLESILSDITSGKTLDLHQNITYIDSNTNGTDFAIVSGPVDLLTGNIESLSTSTIESILNITQQSLNVEPLVRSTPVPLGSTPTVQPSKQHTEVTSSGPAGSHVVIVPLDNLIPASNPVVAEGKSTNVRNDGNTIIQITKPKLANMEGVPVHVERIPEVTTSVDHVIQSNSRDVSGALSILKEIRSFKPISEQSASPRHKSDIENKLSDPNFVKQLRALLKTMIKKTGSSSTTTASLVSMSTDIPDMTTMSLPVSSTEEYEFDEYMTTPDV